MRVEQVIHHHTVSDTSIAIAVQPTRIAVFCFVCCYHMRRHQRRRKWQGIFAFGKKSDDANGIGAKKANNKDGDINLNETQRKLSRDAVITLCICVIGCLCLVVVQPSHLHHYCCCYYLIHLLLPLQSILVGRCRVWSAVCKVIFFSAVLQTTQPSHSSSSGQTIRPTDSLLVMMMTGSEKSYLLRLMLSSYVIQDGFEFFSPIAAYSNI